MKKIIIGMMMLVLLPFVTAVSMSGNYPVGVIIIPENNSMTEFGVMINYDPLILPDMTNISNPWCGEENITVTEIGNVTLTGCINNESQALGQAHYIIPEGDRCFFAWCSYHNQTDIFATVMYDNGTCYISNLTSTEDGVTEFLLEESVVGVSKCNAPSSSVFALLDYLDLGTVILFNQSSGVIQSLNISALVNGEEVSYTYQDNQVIGSINASLGITYNISVFVSSIEGMKNISWSFTTMLPVVPPVVYDDDDDDEPRRHSSSGGGGYVPVILKDDVTKNITVNGSLPKDSIDEPLPSKPVDVTPEINYTPIVVSGSESIDKKSYAWVIWVVIGLLVCGVIGVGLYYLRKEE